MIFSELQQMAPDTPGLEAYSSRIQDLRHKLQQAETYFKQAQEYADQEMWDEALVVLEKAAALRPEDPEIAAYRENLQVERTRHQQDEVGVATEVLGAWETAEKTEFEPPPSQPATVVSMENAYETGKHAAGRLPKWSWALLLIPLVIIGLWVIMSSGNRNVTDESLVATAEPFVAAVEPNTATPTPLSTVTAGPTDMPSPSPTSTGTPTSEPSQTPHPTNLPTRAAPPTATQPVIEDGAVLFEEDFAPFLYYQVSYWGGGRDVWQEIFDESQNKVFDGNNIDGPYEYPRFIFGSDTWENYTAQFRIRIVEQTEQWTSASFSFRCNSRFHCYSIHFNAMENMVILAVSDANNPYTELEVETVEIEIGRWHDIEVIALGNDLQVYIDNVSVFEFTDSNRPAGNFHVVVDRGMHVQIDDIQITNRR